MSEGILLTQKDIDNILDQTKSHAKVVCDRIYDETAKEIGGNDQFKYTIDKVFDPVAEVEIGGLKEYFADYFNHFDSINTKKIYEYINMRRYIQCTVPARGYGKIFISTAVDTINQSVTLAFTEKLAEYLDIDIKEVTK